MKLPPTGGSHPISHVPGGEPAPASRDQAVAFDNDHGIPIRRLLTDRGSTYRSKLFAQTCQELGLKHSLHTPLPPTDQRQGQTLHPDHHSRMGLRTLL